MVYSYGEGTAAVARARRPRRTAPIPSKGSSAVRPTLTVDPYRHVVFPNNIRDVRLAKGHLKLLPFSARLADIPYIRLSKIERGEVFARADELIRIAGALDVAPASLLIDVASPGFDMAAWFAPFAEGASADDPAEAQMALLLAAAVRRARADDPKLTAATVNEVFGIAPVILSRLENAYKGLARWSPDIIAAAGRMLGDRDEPTLREWLDTQYAEGKLDPFLAEIIGSEDRQHRSKQRIAALAIELENPVERPGSSLASAVVEHLPRRLELLGIPDGDGTISLVATGETVAAPPDIGARAYGVRVSRATLGPGLPAGTIVVVDPDRYPRAGGLALMREGQVYRLVSVVAERTGALVGHSLYPEREIAMDTLEPDAVSAVVAAFFG